MRRLACTLVLLSIGSSVLALDVDFINDCILPTGTKVQERSVGGLSALVYNQSQREFIALSDFKKSADPHLVHLQMTNQNGYCLKPTKTEIFTDKSGQKMNMDGEGLALLPDGRFLVSSERSSNENTNFAYPELMSFAQNRIMLSKLEAPQAFYPKTEQFNRLPKPQPPLDAAFTAPLNLPEEPTYTPNNRSFKRWIPDTLEYWAYLFKHGLWKKNVKTQTTLAIQKQRDTQAQAQAKYQEELRVWSNSNSERFFGFQFNAGYEALSFDAAQSILTVAAEKPLHQDLFNNVGLHRILRMKLDSDLAPTGKALEFYYRADTNMRISEILDVGQNVLFVLEIFFNPVDEKVSAKIYQTELKPQMGSPSTLELKSENGLPILEKHLLFDLNALEGKFHSDYKRLDNLEGMTLGPRLSTGERLLVLVSDDNGKKYQKTQFLFFKVRGL